MWESSTGQPCAQLSGGRYSDVLFSPDGRWLVTRSDKEYSFWKVGVWTLGHAFAHKPDNATHEMASLMAFSPDGRTLALSDAESVRLVDPATGREFATLEAENTRENSSLGFGGDGRWLAVAGGSDSLHVWDLRTLREHLSNIGLDWEAPPLPPPTQLEVGITKVTFTSESPSPVSHTISRP